MIVDFVLTVPATYESCRSGGTHTDIAFGNNHRGFQLAQNYGHVHIPPGERSLISTAATTASC